MTADDLAVGPPDGGRGADRALPARPPVWLPAPR